jgi:hypothetical protein
MTIKVYVLLGGLWGVDGYLDSTGMEQLATEIKTIPGTDVETYSWSSYQTVLNAISNLPVDTKIVLVGYSGGGSRATYVANGVYPRTINLIIGYDPSPTWQMQPMKNNVVKAITYYNTRPLMLGLGGGKYSGSSKTEFVVDTIAQQHLALQFNSSLHAITLEEIKKL